MIFPQFFTLHPNASRNIIRYEDREIIILVILQFGRNILENVQFICVAQEADMDWSRLRCIRSVEVEELLLAPVLCPHHFNSFF